MKPGFLMNLSLERVLHLLGFSLLNVFTAFFSVFCALAFSLVREGLDVAEGGVFVSCQREHGAVLEPSD